MFSLLGRSVRLGDAAGGAMNPAPSYTEFHPRWHRRRMTTYWWLHKGAYLRFILRELSCVFIAYFVVVTLVQIDALSRGMESCIRSAQRVAAEIASAQTPRDGGAP